MKFNGHNVTISPDARIGTNVRIGDNTVIYPGVEIGDGSIVCNDSVLGEPLAEYYHDAGYKNPPTIIGSEALIRSHAIIYAGCRIGSGFSSGHRITIRENTTIGEHCMVGTLTDLQGNVTIGSYCRLHSNVHIAQNSSIGDFVFFYPYSVMTNDPWPPSEDIRGSHIGDFTQVGVHAVILPDIQVGENCLIGANATVGKNLPSYTVAMGDPARVAMDIRDFVAMGKGRPYPWMKRFDRGMPWEGIDFDQWMQASSGNRRP